MSDLQDHVYEIRARTETFYDVLRDGVQVNRRDNTSEGDAKERVQVMRNTDAWRRAQAAHSNQDRAACRGLGHPNRVCIAPHEDLGYDRGCLDCGECWKSEWRIWSDAPSARMPSR